MVYGTIDQDWVVAIAQPQRHDMACESLAKLDFEAYVPKFSKSSIVRGRHVKSVQPLFGRYFFVRFNKFWREVATARGVTEVLLYGIEGDLDNATPYIVSKSALNQIVAEESLRLSRMRFRIGERVTAQSGPFAGAVGVYNGVSVRERELAFFDLLGRKVSVEFKNTGDLVAVA